MPLYTIDQLNYIYTGLLHPRKLEPDYLSCIAKRFQETEGEETEEVIVRYKNGKLQFITSTGLAHLPSIDMVKPTKIDAAFDQFNNLVYGRLYQKFLFIETADESIAFSDITGFALFHEDLRFGQTHRVLLVTTSGPLLRVYSNVDNFSTPLETVDIQDDEYIHTAGMNEDFRIHYTLRKIVDLSGPRNPTPSFIIAGEKKVTFNGNIDSVYQE